MSSSQASGFNTFTEIYIVVQWRSEIRTNPAFGWSILTRTGYPNIDHPKTGPICPVLGWSKD
jgi:hypothetical protein